MHPLTMMAYWPLCNLADFGCDPGDAIPPNKAAEIVQKLRDADPQVPMAAAIGVATSCLWRLDSTGRASPVLVLDRASEIHDHMAAWAEGDVLAWFNVYAQHAEPARPGDEVAYAVALFPNVRLSVERWQRAYEVRHGRQEAAELAILLRPISFATALSTTYRSIAERIPPVGQPIHVGLIDSTHCIVKKELPPTIDAKKVIELGPIKRGDCWEVAPWLDAVMADLMPTPGPTGWGRPSLN